MRSAYDIILKPVISEKAMDGMQERKYTFRVAVDANKLQIKNAVEEIFDVDVEKVTTMNMKGKPRRVRYVMGKTSDWKKAVVKLTPSSKTIEFFDSLM